MKGEIKLAFYPGGYNGLDVFVDDFWSVKIDAKKHHAEAEFFVHLPATQKDEVLRRAEGVLTSLKEATK